MCGISGVIFKNKNKKNYTIDIHAMNEIVKHRGPDGSGVYIGDNFIFGHTRLSIIDLSETARQPMEYEERFVLTFNGEIYNYLELKEELINLGRNFKSNSDTEVLLIGYAQWGEEVVLKLNGEFSFAIFDKEKNSCFIARDRAGVKPLYFHETDEEFYFCSEPKQLIFSNIIKAIPNNNSINEYLAYQFSLSDETFFHGIKKVMPGNHITLKNFEKINKKYWSVDDLHVNSSIEFEEAKESIKKLLIDSVKLRLRSDVDVGCYLSGGIDSSIISSIAANYVKDLNTFTFTSKKFPSHDESILANATSNFIKSKQNEVEIDFEKIVNIWKKSIYYMDEPEVGYSLLSQMAISEQVSKKIKVILGGQGGDEIFYGYAWHTQIALLFKINNFSLHKKIQIILHILKQNKIKFNLKFIFELIKSNLKKVEINYFDFWKSNGLYDVLLDKEVKLNFISKLNFKGCILDIKKFEYKYWLQGLLHVEDRSSMYASLESRVPFLDHRITDYVFKLNPSYLIDGGLNKKILISTFANDLLPEISENKFKKGYASPIKHWFENQETKKFIFNIIENKNSFIYKYVKFKENRKFTEKQLWMLISLEIWYKTFISREFVIDK